jgi:hypothetical protein
MKAEKTVRAELRELRLRLGDPRLRGDRAEDQTYGAAEALRWVLGEGPRPVGLSQPMRPKET